MVKVSKSYNEQPIILTSKNCQKKIEKSLIEKNTHNFSYYYYFLQNINHFNDEFSSFLEDLSFFNDQFIFKKLARRFYIELDTEYYCVQNNCIVFSNNYYRVPELEKSFSSADFLIGFARKQYLIPFEAIENNCINISELQKWEI